MKNISPKTAGYYININGVRFDARKLVWRAFTDTKPAYSSEHYKIHIIDDARNDKFSFDNLDVAVVSSISISGPKKMKSGLGHKRRKVFSLSQKGNRRKRRSNMCFEKIQEVFECNIVSRMSFFVNIGHR